MASPQLENGYTKIANELLDAMCRLHLTGNQWMVLHAIIRRTYGWNKKEDWISGSQIAEMTGLHRSRVCESLRELQQLRVILRDGNHTGVQKDYTIWNVTENRNIQNVTENRNTVTEKRNKVLRNSRHTKDNKDIIQKTGIPPAPKLISDQVHPAIRILMEITGRGPRKGTYEYRRVVETVTDNNGNLDKWRTVVQEWQLTPYQKTNLRGMLDWFTNGIPSHRPGGEKTQQQAADDQDEEYRRKKRAYYLSKGLDENGNPIRHDEDQGHAIRRGSSGVAQAAGARQNAAIQPEPV